MITIKINRNVRLQRYKIHGLKLLLLPNHKNKPSNSNIIKLDKNEVELFAFAIELLLSKKGKKNERKT